MAVLFAVLTAVFYSHPGVLFEDTLLRYYDEDGSWHPFITVRLTASNSLDSWDGFELDAGTIVRFAEGPGLSHRGSWGFYALALLCSVVCALDVAFPLALFHLRYALAVEKPEPTDFYLGAQRIGWIVCTAAILILYLYGLLSVYSP